jgi:hypothetical protein
VLSQQQRRDEEPGEDEEHIHSHIPTIEPEPPVIEEYKQHSERSKPFEMREKPLNRPDGRRWAYGDVHRA